MTNDDWKTLRVPEDAYDEAKAQKEENNRTWGEQIVRDSGKDTDDLEPEELAERIGENLERDVDLSPVLNRLDDLQSQLPNDVAGELR